MMEYISIFKCISCDGEGKIRNPEFERCTEDYRFTYLGENCKDCPAKEGCILGEFIDCEKCNGNGVLRVNHREFQQYALHIRKKVS